MLPPGPFVFALLVVLVVSLLPTRWVAWSTGRVAEIVSLPLVPIGDLLSAARIRLSDDAQVRLEERDVAILEQQLNAYRRHYHRLVQDLLGGRDLNAPTVGITAQVTGGGPNGTRAILQLNAGSRRGVQAGDVVLFDQEILLGRILGGAGAEVGPTDCYFLPTFDVETGLVQGVLVLTDAPGDGVAAQRRATVLLEPDGKGWRTTVSRRADPVIGMDVRLGDPDWPRSAQGLRVGVVAGISDMAGDPSRVALEIMPLKDPSRVRDVQIETSTSDGGGDL